MPSSSCGDTGTGVRSPSKKAVMTSDDESTHNTSTSAGVGATEETTEVPRPKTACLARRRLFQSANQRPCRRPRASTALLSTPLAPPLATPLSGSLRLANGFAVPYLGLVRRHGLIVTSATDAASQLDGVAVGHRARRAATIGTVTNWGAVSHHGSPPRYPLARSGRRRGGHGGTSRWWTGHFPGL
jgi:hypothetical protein